MTKFSEVDSTANEMDEGVVYRSSTLPEARSQGEQDSVRLQMCADADCDTYHASIHYCTQLQSLLFNEGQNWQTIK